MVLTKFFLNELLWEKMFVENMSIFSGLMKGEPFLSFSIVLHC